MLKRFGHTAVSAFLDAYEGIDLHAWFERADVDPTTRRTILTWRGALDG